MFLYPVSSQPGRPTLAGLPARVGRHTAGLSRPTRHKPRRTGHPLQYCGSGDATSAEPLHFIRVGFGSAAARSMPQLKPDNVFLRTATVKVKASLAHDLDLAAIPAERNPGLRSGVPAVLGVDLISEIRIAVEQIPPLLMTGLRFLVAGPLLLLWCWFRGRKVAVATAGAVPPGHHRPVAVERQQLRFVLGGAVGAYGDWRRC